MKIFKILFGLEGRINRLQFWVALMVLVSSTFLVYFAAGKLRLLEGETGRIAPVILGVLWMGVLIWALVAVSTKRWHDMNLSGLMTLLWLVPLAGPVIVVVWLGFGPGKNHHRQQKSYSSSNRHKISRNV